MTRPSDRAIAQAFAEFQEATTAVPVGHYDGTKGSSTYNWRRSFESSVLARATELDATAAPVVVGEDAVDARRFRDLCELVQWGEWGLCEIEITDSHGNSQNNWMDGNDDIPAMCDKWQNGASICRKVREESEAKSAALTAALAVATSLPRGS